MRWFQLFKAHTFINDVVGGVNDLVGRVRDLEERKEADKQEIRAVFEQCHREFSLTSETFRLQQAEATKFELLQLRKAVADMKSDVGKFLAEQQAVVTEMLKDAEEIKRTVERLHRREAEFTSMIDARCRSIGEKIHKSMAGDIEREADRAVKAATEAKLVLAQAEASFTEKLAAHKRTVDAKLNLMAETVGKFETSAAETLTKMDEKLAAARAVRPARTGYRE